MGLLRLLLALSVVTAHCGAIYNIDFVGGQIAVQAFYIISGFYMSLILNEKYVGQNGSYKLFISNRILRLYPIYWVVLILTVLFSILNGLISADASLLRIDYYTTYIESISTIIFLFLTQILIIGQDIVMFMGFDTKTLSMYFTSNYSLELFPMHLFIFIPQAWTLGIEVSFYLIAPFILRKNWKVVSIFFFASLALKLYIHLGLKLVNDPWSYRFFPSELMFFFLGYFCYQLSCKIKGFKIPKSINLIIFCVLILFTLFYSKIPYLGKYLFLREVLYFLYFILSLPFLFIYFKNIKWDTKIGDLSYPVYISHMFIYLIYSACGFQYANQGPYIALWCILFAILLNKFVSSPIEKYRQSRVTI